VLRHPPLLQLLYSLLLELLAGGGYTVVATPYAVTFRHLDCAVSVRSAFDAAVQVGYEIPSS
jgi:hypothetical protein